MKKSMGRREKRERLTRDFGKLIEGGIGMKNIVDLIKDNERIRKRVEGGVARSNKNIGMIEIRKKINGQ